MASSYNYSNIQGGYEETIFWVNIFTAVIGTGASALLVWIICDLKVWNDFNILVLWMSAFLCVHFAFLFAPALAISDSSKNSSSYTGLILDIIEAFGGTCSYFVSSILSFSVTYLMVYKKIFALKLWKNTLIAFVLLPNLIYIPICIYGMIHKDEIVPGVTFPKHSTYFEYGYFISNFLRLVPVAFNIICYLLNLHMMRRMFVVVGRTGESRLKHETAIVRLVDRLKWYPLLQVMARLFPTWISIAIPNSATTSYSFEDCDQNGADGDKCRYFFSLYILLNIGQLVAPVGFLFVYLRMQRRKIDLFSPRLSLRKQYKVESSDGSTHVVSENPKYTSNSDVIISSIASHSLTSNLLSHQSPQISSYSPQFAQSPSPNFGSPLRSDESPFSHSSIEHSTNDFTNEQFDILDDNQLITLIGEGGDNAIDNNNSINKL